MIEAVPVYSPLPQVVRNIQLFPRNRSSLPPVDRDPRDIEVIRLLETCRSMLEGRCYAWITDMAYTFKLPQSRFSNNRNKPLIEFVRHNEVDEGLEVLPLSDDQLASIKEDGTFLVYSPKYPIPYKWILTEWIYKGKKRTLQTLTKNIGTCFSMLYFIGQFFTSNQYLSFKKRMFHTVYFFWKLIRLFIGIRSNRQQNIYQVQSYLELLRQNELHRTVWAAINHSFFDYLSGENKAQMNQRKQNLCRIYSQFYESWKRRIQTDEKALLARFSDAELPNMLNRQALQHFQNEFRSSNLPANLIEHMIQLLEDTKNIEQQNRQMVMQLNEGYTNIQKELKVNYPIASQSRLWLNNHQDKGYKQIQQKLLGDLLSRLSRLLKTPFYRQYLQYHNEHERQKEQLEPQMKRLVPNRTFTETYHLFPPYEVNCSENGVYSLVRQKHYEVKVDHEFWKIQLFFVRWWTYFRNILAYCIYSIIYGPLGIYVLLRCKRFYPEVIINSDTGEVGRDPNEYWVPIVPAVQQTCQHVSRARQEFENAPDTGFFGKVCGRIFNIIYLYFFVSFLYGIIFLLFIKPVLIVLNIIFTLFLMLTSALWVPIFLLFRSLFCLFVFNYDYEYQYSIGGETEATLRWFPLPMSILKFIWDILMIILTFICIIMTPILSLLWFIFSLIRYVMRRIYDTVMYIFVSCCGRSPIKDTCVAWKVSGPGSANSYFYNIREQDVYILVMVEMEKIQLDIFKEAMNQALDDPRKVKQAALRPLNDVLPCILNTNSTIESSISFYQNKLQEQVRQRMRNMPENGELYNVRFVEDQLNLYLLNSREIVQNHVSKNPTYDFFKYMGVERGNYDNLTVEVWKRIFQGDSVFQPLEKVDQRIEIVERREADEMDTIMSTIRKDVKFKKSVEHGEKFVYKNARAVSVPTQRRIYPDNYISHLNVPALCDKMVNLSNEAFYDSYSNMELLVLVSPTAPEVLRKTQQKLQQESDSFI